VLIAYFVVKYFEPDIKSRIGIFPAFPRRGHSARGAIGRMGVVRIWGFTGR